MIGHLKGRVVHTDPRFFILETGGVGYRVFGSPDILFSFSEGDEVTLWIHTSVGENYLHLYGFETKKDLDFFELLLGVSGIGPRSALGIISIAPAGTLMNAIAEGDISYLTKVSGVGKKSAEKIVLELRDKLGSIEDVKAKEMRKEDGDALDALTSLGYSAADARDVLKKLSDIKGTQDKIREALKLLGS